MCGRRLCGSVDLAVFAVARPMRIFSSIDRLNRPASWKTVAIDWRRDLRVTPARIDAVDQDAACDGRIDALQQIDQRRLAGAGRPDDRHGLAGPHLERHSCTPCPELANSKLDILEPDMAGDLVEFAQAGRLLALNGIILEAIESSSFTRASNIWLTKADTWSSRPISSAAKPVNAMMSPIRNWPIDTSSAPIISTTIIEMVEASRCSALATAHQSSTGFCAVSSSRTWLLQRLRLMADAIVALQHRDVADRIRHMRKDVMVVALDRPLALIGLAHDQPADRDIGDPASPGPGTSCRRAKTRSAPAAPAPRRSRDAGA